jgi:hypothetical protein
MEGALRSYCSRSSVTRWARASGVGLSWKAVAARPVALGTRERQRLAGSAQHRKRTPEQRAPRGSKWVKRRDPQHPPASIRRAGSRRETRVLIFDKWVARSRSTGLVSGLASARGSGLYRTWVRLREFSTESRGEAWVKRPVLPHVPDRWSRDWQPHAARRARYRRARRFGPSLPRFPKPEVGRTRALGRQVAPSGAPALTNVGALASGACMPTGSARDRQQRSRALSANGAEGPRARDARRRAEPFAGKSQPPACRSKLANANTVAIRRGRASANSAGPSAETPFVVNDASISGSRGR